MGQRRWAVTCVLVLAGSLGAGCGSSGGAGSGGGAGGGKGGGAGGGTISADDVNGSRIDSYLLKGGGFQTRPVNLTNATINAWSVQPDGGYLSFAGSGTANGTFNLPGVPMGPYYLRVGSSIVYTSARVVELGAEYLGRPNTYVADAGTGLALTLTNLAPWTANDDLQLASWNAGLGYYSTANGSGAFTAGEPNPNDTQLTAAALEFGDWGFYSLIEASQGDELVVTQLSGRTLDGGIRIQEATRGFSSSTVEMAQGVLHPVSGALTTLTPTAATIDFRFADFAALATSVHPQAAPATGYVYLDLNPGPLTQRLSADNPDLVTVTLAPPAANVVLPVWYGNPYPASWTPYLYAAASFDVSYSIPLPTGGTTTPRTESASFVTAQAATATAPLAVTLTPARALTLDGLSATAAPLSNVSLTPVIAWSAPATGVPTRYGLGIARLTANSSGTTARTTLFFITLPGSATSIRLPPGLLAAGTHYFLRLTAYADPGPLDPARPFKSSGFPFASATLLSSSFKTQ